MLKLLSGLFPSEDFPQKHTEIINNISRTQNYWSCRKLEDFDSGEEVNAYSEREKCKFVFSLCKSQRFVSIDWAVNRFLAILLKQKLPFEYSEIVELLNWHRNKNSNYLRNISEMIKTIERYLKENPLSDELKEGISKFADVIAKDCASADVRQKVVRLRDLAGVSEIENPLVAGEAWTDIAIADIAAMAGENKTLWSEIIYLCQTSNGSSPNKKWLKIAGELLEKIGFDEFKSHVLKWFPLVDKPRTEQIATWSQWMPNPNSMLNDANADILKGLVWICGLREDREMARALMILAISAYKKVPMIGPRCVRVGNACVWALGQMRLEGVGHLAILKLKVKFGTAQKGIEKALSETAKKAGLPADELEEMSVPDYGLQEVGVARESFGEFAAQLVVTGTNAAELRWFNRDGKPQRSVPSYVKEHHAEALKELANAVRDIKKMLPAQRDRLENLYLEEKRWDYRTWRARYLEHPLVGTLARRLIWRFNQTTGAIFLDGKLVDKDGNALELFDGSQVELWHPLHSSTREVLDWREFLEKHEIWQPFKQAHREIYVLTDAERRTEIYSNRFAAHVIKQHQFNALCGQRNWKNQLRIMADADFHAPMRALPRAGLRAEFWVEAIGSDYGVDSNETGTYLYLATDQVRFYPISAPLHYGHGYGGGVYEGWNAPPRVEPLPLDRIPPLVFSEIMRDVDMFVGVCSIGNDPNWTDNGREQNNDYWYQYSFGDLSATAKTRKEVLERLIPRLKIAPRCTVEDRFLLVKGDLRTYKIHLGSGNILMSPSDQYLCIVPSTGSETFEKGRVFLPFEGDRTLSIILSKAFMLADDSSIADPAIARQIK